MQCEHVTPPIKIRFLSVNLSTAKNCVLEVLLRLNVANDRRVPALWAVAPTKGRHYWLSYPYPGEPDHIHTSWMTEWL
jgi:hypothetical protein